MPMMLNGNLISLRAVEPADIDVLYDWENNTEVWHLSDTLIPFSRHHIEQYVLAEPDIHAQKQLRLMICLQTNDQPIGCVDLFDFNPIHQRAGVGILIANATNRRKGYASETLGLFINYCFSVIKLHQLFCNIAKSNKNSLLLFQKHDFVITGEKKEWLKGTKTWEDEYLLQLINNRHV